MKKLLLLSLLSSFWQHGFGQQNQLLASSKKDSSNIFIGDMHAKERVESVAIARKYAISQLKKDLEVLEKGNKSTLSNELSASNSERTLANETFSLYLAKLDKKYKADIRSIETDNIRDIFQIEQKSEIKRRHSHVVSAQCFSTKNEGNYIKMNDLDGEEIVGFPLENFKGNSRYGLVENFHQGFARIKKDQVFGFLNYCGDEVIPCQFDKADIFNDGKALVKKYEWYFIDVYGNESEALENIVDAKALKYGISVAKFKNGKFALIDNSYDVSKKVLSEYYDDISIFNKDLFRIKLGKYYGLIKLDGSVKIDPIYDNLNSTTEQGKWMIIEQNKKVGLMDTDGNIRLKPTFESISNIQIDPSIAVVSLGLAKDETGVKIIDFKDLRISKTYQAIGEFNKYGLAQVKDGKYFGFINTDLQVVIEPIYRSLGTFNQYGLISACKDGNNNALRCGYIKHDGTEVIPLAFDEVANFNKFGLVVVRENAKNCSMPSGNCKVDMVFDKSGTMIIGKTNEVAPVGIRYATTDTIFNGSYIVIKTFTPTKNGDDEMEFNLVERNNVKRITTQGYKSIRKYDSNLLFPVQKEGKWGLIDTSGKVVAKPAYKEMLYSTEGLYGVKFDNNKYGFIDKKGKVQIAFDYDEIRPFNNGLAIVSKGGGKLGIINRFNAKIAPCYFSEINILPATKQFELIDTSGSKYILNSLGDCVTNCGKFDEIRKLANQ
jgi:hypothetical protein